MGSVRTLKSEKIQNEITWNCANLFFGGHFWQNSFEINFPALTLQPLLAHGVTGNTSDFGSEESRFEP